MTVVHINNPVYTYLCGVYIRENQIIGFSYLLDNEVVNLCNLIIALFPVGTMFIANLVHVISVQDDDNRVDVRAYSVY